MEDGLYNENTKIQNWLNDVKPGILDNKGNIRDASSLVKDWDDENVKIEKLNEVKKINATDTFSRKS